MTAVGEVLAGRYEVGRLLGRGGMAEVYLGTDRVLQRPVAVKVLGGWLAADGRFVERFRREALAAASFSHPDLVAVYDAGSTDDLHFIVMEYVPGETLEAIIANKGALDLPTVLDYTCQIANAVEHAHKQGVIHRDLRPANVFVTDKAVVKVGDFGTSRFLEIAAHGTTVIGSPPYMAPEQFEGRAVFASDLYSLGVTMYQMLTGELPYDTPAPADLDRLRRGELVTPPRVRVPQIPMAIDAVVMRALSGQVSTRYQRAEDFLQDLLGARRQVARRPAPTPQPSNGAAYEAPAPPPPRPAVAAAPAPRPQMRRVTPARLRTREISASRFCWNCRKPLPARASKCPFCSEGQ
jgi:serine/threonine protein kinase